MNIAKIESAVGCSIEKIEWDNINLTIDVRLDAADNYDLATLFEKKSQEPNVKTIGKDVSLNELRFTRDPVVVSEDDENSLRFLMEDNGRAFIVSAQELSLNLYRIKFNITNFFDRKQIPNGTWRFSPLFREYIGLAAQYNISAVSEFGVLSRNFLYNKNRSVYVISFGLSNDDSRPVFLMRSYQFSRGNGGRGKSITGRIRSGKLIPKKRRIQLLQTIFNIGHFLKPRKKTVLLFASEARTELGGNLSAIYDRLHDRNLTGRFVIRFSLNLPKQRSFWERVKQVYFMGQADFIIIDDYFPTLAVLDIPKNKVIIQAWHAGVGFKAVGYSRFGNYGSPKLENPHRKYTYAICGSESLREVYAENFGIDKSSVIPTGLPRVDKFLTDKLEAIELFRSRFPNIGSRRVILFAPTFRGTGMESAYYDFSRIDFERLYDFCGQDTVIAFRMHHFIRESVPISPHHSDRFFDLTDYEDGLGLLHSVDILITDYSSIIYEFSLLDRPMLFFAYDRDVYSATRGFHKDYDSSAPGRVCLTFDSLLDALRHEQFDEHKRQNFRSENFDNLDSGSSDRFIDMLLLGNPAEENS